jgi:hypothetical protein
VLHNVIRRSSIGIIGALCRCLKFYALNDENEIIILLELVQQISVLHRTLVELCLADCLPGCSTMQSSRH